MTYEDWKRTWPNSPTGFGSDRDFGKNVWQGAQSDAWATVFQIVSNNPQMATREFIRQLEAARESAGCGPVTES